MTPDEVVKELKILQTEFKLHDRNAALTSAITQIQDYQKLRERVSVENLEKLLDKNELWVDIDFDIGYATPLSSKDLANAIVKLSRRSAR